MASKSKENFQVEAISYFGSYMKLHVNELQSLH